MSVGENPYDRLPGVASFRLSSRDVRDGERLAVPQLSGIFGAGGEDVSPHLSWDGAPEGTRGFAVTVFDPDAPTPCGFWHWAVADIPGSVTELPADAGADGGTGLPAGAVALRNDAGTRRYLGAAPPPGHGPHRYFFVVHAIDVDSLGVAAETTPAFLSFVLSQHTLGRALLVAWHEA